MNEHIRRFGAWSRKNRERIETPFNKCFDRFLPPREERTAFWLTSFAATIAGFVFILGFAFGEIKVLHQNNQNQAVEIVVDDRA